MKCLVFTIPREGAQNKEEERKEGGREGGGRWMDGGKKVLKHVWIMSTMLECSSDAVFGTTCSERSVIQGRRPGVTPHIDTQY